MTTEQMPWGNDKTHFLASSLKVTLLLPSQNKAAEWINDWGWKWLLEIIWSKPPCPGACPDGFWIYAVMEIPQPVWPTSASIWQHWQYFFLVWKQNFLCFVLCPLPLTLLVVAAKSLDPSAFLLHQVFMYKKSTWASYPTGWTVSTLSIFSHTKNTLVLSSSLWLCTGICSRSLCFSSAGEPRTGPNILDVSHRFWVERKVYLSCPAGSALPTAAKRLLIFSARRADITCLWSAWCPLA